jgi:hypothetical protein
MTDQSLIDMALSLEAQAKTARWMPRGFRSCCKAIRQAIQAGDLVSACHWLHCVWHGDAKPLLRPLMDTVQGRMSQTEHKVFAALMCEPNLPLRPGKVANLILEAKIRKLQARF